MKTAEEIQDEYAQSKGYDNFYCLLKDDLRASDLHVRKVQELYADQVKTKWISVEERTPEFGEEFNCVQDLADGGETVSSITEFDAIKNIFCYPGTDCQQSGITHWMPLPEPPKQ